MNITKLLINSVVTLALVASTHAATLTTATTSGNWSLDSNWSAGAPADTTYNAVVDLAMTLNASAGSIGTLTIGNNTNAGSLTIGQAGSLTVSTLTAVRGDTAGKSATVTLNGGTLTVTGAANFGQTNKTATGTEGKLIINAGSTFEVQGGHLHIGNNVNTGTPAKGYLDVYGTSTISVSDSYKLYINMQGTLTMKLDQSGIGTIDAGSQMVFRSGATFVLDGSEYSGGGAGITDTFTLITCDSAYNNGAGINFNDVLAAANFDSAYDILDLAWSTDNKNLVLTVGQSNVPEPSTYAVLLGALALLALAARRFSKP